MKFWNFLHATASLLVSFYIGSTAYVMDTSFLLLRGGGELIGSLLSAVFFSCLLVIPFTSLVKLVSDDIRLRTTVYALLAGVLLAPLPLAMQEYMFIRKVSPLIEAETSGSPASLPARTDLMEARWWPFDGYSLRARAERPGSWQFQVLD